MEDRIIELEIKVAHQDRLLADLNDVVSQFSSRVEVLERRLDELQQSVGGLPVGGADEKPPHY